MKPSALVIAGMAAAAVVVLGLSLSARGPGGTRVGPYLYLRGGGVEPAGRVLLRSAGEEYNLLAATLTIPGEPNWLHLGSRFRIGPERNVPTRQGLVIVDPTRLGCSRGHPDYAPEETQERFLANPGYIEAARIACQAFDGKHFSRRVRCGGQSMVRIHCTRAR